MNTALALDPNLPRRRFDIHDDRRMRETGILTEADRVELIDDLIIEMSPLTDPHVDLVIVLTERLTSALGNRALVSVQNPLRLDDHTEPQPDFAILKLDRRRGVPLANDTLLVVEVAESSLTNDRETKLSRFAHDDLSLRATDCLLVIDVQKDFCEGGALAVPDGAAVVEPINALMRHYEHVVLTQDWHSPRHSSFASEHDRPAPVTVIDMLDAVQLAIRKGFRLPRIRKQEGVPKS